MKIGIHLSLWAKNWTDYFTDDIERAAQIGFDSVELPLMQPETLDTGLIRRKIEANSLGVFCGTGLSNASDISSEDRECRERGRKHLFTCIEAAHNIGSRLLGGVIHSAWGKAERTAKQNREYSTEVLRSAAEYAKNFGIRLALECINRYESSFLNTVDQGLDLLSYIDMPNVGLHLDTYHMNIEERSIPEAIKRAGSKLFHIHFSENTRGYPGNGHLPWKDIITALKAVNYRSDVVIESYVIPGTPAGDDVKIWRKIESDTGSGLKKSLDFLRLLL